MSVRRADRLNEVSPRAQRAQGTWRYVHVVAGLSNTRCVSTFKFFQKWRLWTKITLCTNLFWTGKFRSFFQMIGQRRRWTIPLHGIVLI